MLALTLSVVIVAYNNVINRWGPFHTWAYVPVNLIFSITVATASVLMLDLSRRDLGFTFDAAGTLLVVLLVVVFAIGVVLLASSRHGHRIADQRIAGMRGDTLAFYVLVRIPLGTAVTEELIFRGVLYAVWLEAGMSSTIATLCAAIAFGLWHIQPTIDGVRINKPEAPGRVLLLAMLGAVLFTTIAGLGLTWLRLESGLPAPVVLHAGINSTAALAAARASRRHP